MKQRKGNYLEVDKGWLFLALKLVNIGAPKSWRKHRLKRLSAHLSALSKVIFLPVRLSHNAKPHADVTI